MGQDPPGWYYVGNGQLRYKFGDFWTDQYKSIDPPGPTIPSAGSASAPASANTSPDVRQPRLSTSRLSIAVCSGLLGLVVGGGLLVPSIPHELASWATALTSQISALISPQAPHTPATSSDGNAKAKADAGAKAKADARAKAKAKADARTKAKADAGAKAKADARTKGKADARTKAKADAGAKAKADAQVKATPSRSAVPQHPPAAEPKPQTAKPPAAPAPAVTKIAVKPTGR